MVNKSRDVTARNDSRTKVVVSNRTSNNNRAAATPTGGMITRVIENETSKGSVAAARDNDDARIEVVVGNRTSRNRGATAVNDRRIIRVAVYETDTTSSSRGLGHGGRHGVVGGVLRRWRHTAD